MSDDTLHEEGRTDLALDSPNTRIVVGGHEQSLGGPLFGVGGVVLVLAVAILVVLRLLESGFVSTSGFLLIESPVRNVVVGISSFVVLILGWCESARCISPALWSIRDKVV